MVDFDVTGITVDGIDYHVRVVFKSLKRSFTINEGPNSGISINGKTIRDILGTQYSYTMNVEPLSTSAQDQSEYDSFYETISAPIDYRTIKMPYGQSEIVFKAQIISGEDYYYGHRNGHEWWGGMSITFIPIQPQRVS